MKKGKILITIGAILAMIAIVVTSVITLFRGKNSDTQIGKISNGEKILESSQGHGRIDRYSTDPLIEQYYVVGSDGTHVNGFCMKHGVNLSEDNMERQNAYTYINNSYLNVLFDNVILINPNVADEIQKNFYKQKLEKLMGTQDYFKTHNNDSSIFMAEQAAFWYYTNYNDTNYMTLYNNLLSNLNCADVTRNLVRWS